MRRSTSGFTVLEGMIVLSLTGLLMSLVAMYFVRGKQYLAETEAYADVQREAVRTLRRVTDDMNKSANAYADVTTTAFWFLSFAPDDPSEPFVELDETSAKIVWKKWIGYYYDPGTTTLTRNEIPLDSYDSQLTAEPAPVMDESVLRTTTSAKRQALTSRMSAFSISKAARSFNVSLTIQGEAPVTLRTAQDKTVSVTVSATINQIN